MDYLIRLFSLSILAYFFFISISYVFLFILSFVGLIQYRLREKFATPKEILKAKITPPISILAPAYNEELTIIQSINSLLDLEYGIYEVVVINDGSADKTLDILKKEFSLRKTARFYNEQIKTKEVLGIYKSTTRSNLIVIDKKNGGKADSLNAGINVSSYPLFSCIDADSLLEKEALLQIVHPFMENYSEIVATGGLVRIANGCTFKDGKAVNVRTSNKWIVNFQIVEYFRAFLSGRTSLSMLNCLLVISGAFGLFKKQPVIDVGGYAHGVVGEDMELVVRLHHNFRKQGKICKIYFVPDPVCWTEAPESMKILARQRNRWQRGLAESLFLHITMLLNPKYGTVGMVAMPYFMFMECLSPFVEVFGYIAFITGYFYGALSLSVFFAFFLLAVAFGMVLSLLSLLLEEIAFGRYPRLRDLLKLMLSAVFENFGYRQYLAIVRAKGMIDWMMGKKSWGKMERKGVI